MTRRAWTAVAAGVTAVALLGGCTGGNASDAPSPSGSSGSSSVAVPVLPQYVAMGDSYAAAPGVPETSGAGGCFRSSNNYAQLVAKANGLAVTDVTCSGATTADVLSSQILSIRSTTELVTIGIGGNDLNLFSRLISSCLEAASTDIVGSPCAESAGSRATDALAQISDNVAGVMAAIAEAAPDATVVVVGYPDLLPTSGSCPDRVPIAVGDYPFINSITHGLSELLQAQAKRRGFEFVDLRGPSRGHDICSDDPWINGATVADDGTIPFHPFEVEQQAVAAKIAAFL